MQRFLIGSQDTSNLKIIPVLGYSKQVSDFGDELRRGNRGGNTAPREVFPLRCISPVLIASDAEAAGRGRFVPTAISAATY